MDGVLNETTNTVHKHDRRNAAPRPFCGATDHVTHDNLRLVRVDSTVDATAASKCGRCFDDAGGY